MHNVAPITQALYHIIILQDIFSKSVLMKYFNQHLKTAFRELYTREM